MTISLNVTATRSRAAYLGPERRRPQVLDAALEIAAESGLAGVTMGAIADRMAVSRPVVYACFADRAEVLTGLLERETQLGLQGLFAMLPPERTGSIQQLFVDGFRALFEAVAQRPMFWRIIYAEQSDAALAPAIGHGRAEVRGRIAVVLRPLLERWQVTDLDVAAPVLTDVFLAICETSVQARLTGSGSADPDQLAELFGRAAYRAVRAVPAPPAEVAGSQVGGNGGVSE